MHFFEFVETQYFASPTCKSLRQASYIGMLVQRRKVLRLYGTTF